LGLRNSHDKSFPIGIAIGNRVFVCDNLAFIGDHVIRRKHTIKAKRELPGLVTEIVQPLQAQRIAQNQKLLAYQASPLTDELADHAILNMYRQDIIGVQRIADVLEQWERPGGEKPVEQRHLMLQLLALMAELNSKLESLLPKRTFSTLCELHNLGDGRLRF
jgi:hypothetical protein